MIGAIADNNTFLAALFSRAGIAGPLAARGLRGSQTELQKSQTPAIHGSQPVDSVEISVAGLRLSKAAGADQPHQESGQDQSQDISQSSKTSADSQSNASTENTISGVKELSQEDQAAVRKLKEGDREVRRHEQAHKSAAGGLATGGPTFEFQSGPDGKRYAVGGEVNIDTSPVSGDPQATIRKMQQVRRAALAPANPSSQDRAVAAQAAAAEQSARAELAKQKQTSSESNTGTAEASQSNGTAGSAFGANSATKSTASATQISTEQANRVNEIMAAGAAVSQIPELLSSSSFGRILDAVA